MNNQNYNQQPQQPQQPVYQQPVYQQPMQPQAPKAPKAPLFNNDLLGLIGCTASIVGFGLVIVSLCAARLPVYGLILNILAFLFSAGGCVLSYIVGNSRIKSGAPRGTVATLGLIFGAAAFLLCLFTHLHGRRQGKSCARHLIVENLNSFSEWRSLV